MTERIAKELDTSAILEKLRQNPDNKLELWDEVKIISITKIVTLVYAASMLVVTLRVQLNILGGYLYKETIVTDNKCITVDLQSMYLSLIQQLIGDGLMKLIDLVKRNVIEILKRYNLKQKLTLADTETMFWSIQMAVNNDPENPVKNLVKYVLPEEVNGCDVLNKMYIETLDVLESPEVVDLCMSNISQGFSSVIDRVAEFYIEPTPGPSSDKSMLNAGYVANINKVEIPLAKLIPIFNGLATKTASPEDANPDLVTSLVGLYLLSDKIKTLGANVYETFCQ
jgi:peroxin-3